MLNEKTLKALIKFIPNFVLACFVGIILYRMVVKDYTVSIPDVILTTTLVIFSSGVVERIEMIAIGEKGVSARFNKVEQDITIINQIAKHVLTNGERIQLERLAGQEDSLNAIYSPFLEQEMVRLCQHHFVKENKSGDVWKMKEKGQDEFDLRTYFRITEEGRNYLEILKKLEKQQQLINDQE